MKKNGTTAFALALLFFAVFAIDVAMGAFRVGAFLNDVSEMLMLFAAVVCFVVGILARAAAINPSPTKQTAE